MLHLYIKGDDVTSATCDASAAITQKNIQCNLYKNDERAIFTKGNTSISNQKRSLNIL